MLHELTTAEIIILLVLCAIVGGTMAVIMTIFLRKLKKIEKAFWGDKA